MPTIAEILAAKQAAKAPAAAAEPRPAEKKLTLAEKAAKIEQEREVTEAIDRIDPPGKREKSESHRATVGLVLNRNMPVPENGEPRGQATPIGGPEERALSATSGEVIDMTPVGADPATVAWHAAQSALESDLCVMRDPSDPEACWLALTSAGPDRQPLLLHRLPWLLYEAPATATGAPF